MAILVLYMKFSYINIQSLQIIIKFWFKVRV